MSPKLPLVLVVDAAAVIRDLLRYALSQFGFDTQLASSVEQAVEFYRDRWRDVAVVLIEVKTPSIDRPATLAVFREINPAVRICFMGDHADDRNESDSYDGGTAYIRKPFDLGELSSLLKGLCDS